MLVALQTSPLPAVPATCFAAAWIFGFCIWSSLTDTEEAQQRVVVRLVRADALLAGDILLFPNPECRELPGRAWQMIEGLFAVPDKWLHVSLLHSWG